MRHIRIVDTPSYEGNGTRDSYSIVILRLL